jgi:site-specific DNA-methyltransferase (adenine-specific)
MFTINDISIYNEDCIKGLDRISDCSVDVILTDPPYLYLQNQKLDRPFDECAFFNQCKRILKPDGFIVMFGRGTSFYRWNTILANIGFKFKEEIIWNKGYSTSPLMNLSRIHESVSIHTLRNGKINKCKIPYLEMKGQDIDSIITDIKRLMTVFTNEKSLKTVKTFLETNKRDVSGKRKANNYTISTQVDAEDRCVSVMRSMKQGYNGKTIIRSDYDEEHKTPESSITYSDKISHGDRCNNVMQSIKYGMNEKSIIDETPNRYKAIHPTEKPVRLMERLLGLVLPDLGGVQPLVVDPFLGSASTLVAAFRCHCKAVGFEIDKEYYDNALERIKNDCSELRMF